MLQKILYKLKLAFKINISAFIAMTMMLLSSIVFYFFISFLIKTVDENSSSTAKVRYLTNEINMKIGDLDYITLKDSLVKVDDFQQQSMHAYDVILKDIKLLSESSFFSNNEKAIKIIRKIHARVEGYKIIADSLKAEIKDDKEDGLYAILALASARQKIFKELESLNSAIGNISAHRVALENQRIKIIQYLLLLLSVIIFIFVIFFNKIISDSIVRKINNLKSTIESFFDLLEHKREKVLHISQEGIDEISEISNYIDTHLYIAEDLITRERKEAEKIEQKVKEATKEIQTLNDEIEATQREIVFTMGAIAEKRSKETGDHVKRVAEYSLILARFYGMDIEEAILLKNASPMHDLGKIGIPDTILNKAGKFTDEEFAIMQSHAEIGYDMLKHSNRSILKAAAILAHEHHERWDGKGYPQGLKGNEIHIYGRITAITDVFDALGSDRVYKKAWPLQKIVDLFIEERGKQFDPQLVDIFLDNLEHFLAAKENIENNEASLSRYIENFNTVSRFI